MARYRFQIQLDVYADNDKKAYTKISKKLNKISNIHNERIIYGAETPFASFEHRELDISSIEYQYKMSDEFENDEMDFDFF